LLLDFFAASGQRLGLGARSGDPFSKIGQFCPLRRSQFSEVLPLGELFVARHFRS
jgi:hypothetical protein